MIFFRITTNNEFWFLPQFIDSILGVDGFPMYFPEKQRLLAFRNIEDGSAYLEKAGFSHIHRGILGINLDNLATWESTSDPSYYYSVQLCALFDLLVTFFSGFDEGLPKDFKFTYIPKLHDQLFGDFQQETIEAILLADPNETGKNTRENTGQAKVNDKIKSILKHPELSSEIQDIVAHTRHYLYMHAT